MEKEKDTNNSESMGEDELNKWLEQELSTLEGDIKILEQEQKGNSDKNENEELAEIIKSMDFNSASGSEASESENLTDIDRLINNDVPNADEGKKKKKSFFKKLFSGKKKKKEEKDDLNEEEILSETGSTSEDMSDLGLDKSKDLFGEIDELDDLEDRTPKKEKKKKEKKKKAKKEKKPKEQELRIKKKKEKPYVREEIIHFSPVSIIFMVTIICLVVLGVYFGAQMFSYSSNINAASSYYVDKEYAKAYDLLAGMDLKEKDKDFYSQVLNIMKVEKHMDDFHTYRELGYDMEALEALMRGVEAYDANIGASSELGTTEVLNSILNDIDTSLQNYYEMSVEEIRTLLQLGNNTEIAKVIYEKAK